MKPWKRKEQNGHLLGVKKCYMKFSSFPKKTVFNLCCWAYNPFLQLYDIQVTDAKHKKIGKKGDVYTSKHLRMVWNIDIPIPWRPLYNDWYVLSLQIFTITTLSAYIGFNRQKVIHKLETLFLRIYSISTLADPQLGNKNKRNVSKTNFSSVFTQYV